MRESLHAVLAVAEWLLLILCIVVGFFFGLSFFNMFLCIAGWSIFTTGMAIHFLSHKEHPKAHKSIEEIDYVASKGIYSWVRHPGYLGLILAYLGLAIAFGSVLALVVAVLFAVHHYRLACREEKMMLEKFGERYAKYME
ncbi:MAG: methyltransferase family protein, partial [Candidatus Baldrarchaeia archaeon]